MADAPGARRCIVVAPAFPPSGLPTAHRARLFVRHLARYGWTPVVVTVDERDREEAQEPALAATVPADVRIVRVRALPARLTRRFGVGDIGLRALGALARRTVRLARESPGAIVLLVVPPWYLVWLAPVVRSLGRVPVVVDYVDPWRLEARRSWKRTLAAWLATATEGWALRGAAGVFAVSDGILRDLRDRFPRMRDVPGSSAGYGFEPSDLALAGRNGDRGADAAPTTSATDEALARLVYVGAISESQLPVLAALLDAVVEVRRRVPGDAVRLRVELYGTSYAPTTGATGRAAQLIAERGLAGIVHERPARIPYGAALSLAAASTGNLVLGDLTTYYAASKLMPLLAVRRPLIALLHGGSEPATVLRRLGARGLVCYGVEAVPSPSTAIPAIADALVELLHDRIPAMTPDFAADPGLRDRTADRMTGALASLLDRVAAAPSPARNPVR